jgi:hypothetical protein
MLQGATPEMRVYIEQNGATYTNIASDSLEFFYGTAPDATGFVIVTNSSVTAASGYFTLDFTAANLNTNGSFFYTVLLKDAGGGMYWSGNGSLEIKKTTVTGSPSALSLTTPIDWSAFTYSSPGSAPMVVGTNLLAATNASGQVTVSAANSSSGDFMADGSVPMTGDINVGGQDITNAANIQLSGGTGTQGTFSWNTDEETADLICDGAVLQLGQELYWHVRNSTASTITNGTMVYASGTVGASGRITVAPFLADGSIGAHLMLGIATVDIPAGEDGKVTDFGKVRGIDTSTWEEGHILYPSATVAGGTNIKSPVAFVITKHASNGTIAVRVHPADDNEYLMKSGGTMSGDLNMGGQDITNAVNVNATTGTFTTVVGTVTETDTLATVLARGADGNAVAQSNLGDLTLGGFNRRITFNTNNFGTYIEENSEGLDFIEGLGDNKMSWLGGQLDLNNADIVDVDSVDAASLELDGTTNVTQTVLTLNGTNYISWVLTGSSVTNLMALE